MGLCAVEEIAYGKIQLENLRAIVRTKKKGLRSIEPNPLKFLARPARFELATYGFVVINPRLHNILTE